MSKRYLLWSYTKHELFLLYSGNTKNIRIALSLKIIYTYTSPAKWLDQHQ